MTTDPAEIAASMRQTADLIEQDADGRARVADDLEMVVAALRKSAMAGNSQAELVRSDAMDVEYLTTEPPVEPPAPPPVQPGYPEPSYMNVLEPGGISLGNGGSFSSRHESIGEAIRSKGGDSASEDICTFDGWDFPEFTVNNTKPGSRIDMIRCIIRDATREGLAVDFRPDAGDPPNSRPGGLHLRVFDSQFLDNFDPLERNLYRHTVAAFFRSRVVDDCSLETYNTLFLNSGSPADDARRDKVAGKTDHALYLQGRGKHHISDGCAWINYANMAAKGGWESVEHRNSVFVNGGCGGFFGADEGQFAQHGEFRTQGLLENVVIYGQTDLVAEDMPQAWGWLFQGGCDAVLNGVIVANPRPTVTTDRQTSAFRLKAQGERRIKIHFGEDCRVFGYDTLFSWEGPARHDLLDVTGTEPRLESALPTPNLNFLNTTLLNGDMRPDEAYGWLKSELGVG